MGARGGVGSLDFEALSGEGWVAVKVSGERGESKELKSGVGAGGIDGTSLFPQNRGVVKVGGWLVRVGSSVVLPGLCGDILTFLGCP